eukprot:scaffold14251_cov70-Cyclotella_meneghiniana.AAC.2
MFSMALASTAFLFYQHLLVNIITLLSLYFTDTATVSHRARRPNRRVYGDGVHDLGVMYPTRRPRSSSSPYEVEQFISHKKEHT